MVTVRLKGTHTSTAKGKKYYYAWRGGPRLRGQPGSPEFMRSYQEACSGAGGARTLAAAVKRYRKSEEFRKLSAHSQRAYTAHLKTIERELGHWSYAATQNPKFKKVIREFRDDRASTPRTADYRVQVLSALLGWLTQDGEIATNLAEGFPRLHRADRSDVTWAPQEIEAVCAHLPDSAARIVALAAFTGLRQADLLRLTRPMDKGDHLEVRTSKTGKTAIIPLLPEARALLDSAPKGMILLPNSRGNCYTPDGFRAVFFPAAKRAGIEGKRFHDLRGTAATNFILAGLSDLEVAEIMGWSEARVADIRRRYVNRGRIVQAVIHRLGKGKVDGC